MNESSSQNPFTFTISPELFVGYGKETENLLKSVRNREKATLLVGPTGSGKTTMLRHIARCLDGECKILYIPKPPKEPADFVEIFSPFIKGFFDFLRPNGVNLYNLGPKLNEKLKGKKFLFFVDECHEASVESLEWMRALADQVDSISIVMAGLPTLNKMLKDNLETFLRRVNTKVELVALTKYEVRDLVKKRIESAGGNDIKPFTDEAVNFVYQRTGGFPREVIRLCYELFEKSRDSNVANIDTDFARQSQSSPMAPLPKPVSMDFAKSLPDKQRAVVEILGNSELTPVEIVSKLKPEEYKNRDIAIRSVNNILRRMMSEGITERNKHGKAYKYSVSEKYRTVMVRA
jgi:type II secretory pathway predicted ATPase ExeA